MYLCVVVEYGKGEVVHVIYSEASDITTVSRERGLGHNHGLTGPVSITRSGQCLDRSDRYVLNQKLCINTCL